MPEVAFLSAAAALVAALVYIVKVLIIEPLITSPLSDIPGPKSFALTRWRLAWEDWNATRTRTIHRLHSEYRPVVRIGPNEVSFNSLSALRTIYGPGSRFGRTKFYRMFDVYGEQNLFTFHSTKEHGNRKKLLSHAYSKSVVLKEPTTRLVEEKARQYLDLISTEPQGISDVFLSMYYYSLDNITAFVYGQHGSTRALQGSKNDQALNDDILHPSRRRLSWFLVHFPSYTKWLYSCKPFMGRINLKSAQEDLKVSEESSNAEDSSIVGQLWCHHESQRPDGMNDMQLASECANHFLAGIDTTSDTLMFLVLALSLPENERFQAKFRDEVMDLTGDSLNEHGHPRVDASDRCTYLNAVIKETLRLYAPLPSNEPRSMDAQSIVDGFQIPPNTVVGMSPYIIHRDPKVFKDPRTFNPERRLGPEAIELNRHFWAFSSGGRMCIGMHLAMAEMNTVTAALYRKYRTPIAPGFEVVAPGITARVEVFSDDRFAKTKVGLAPYYNYLHIQH
ncbi:Cytochrome monooxygenase aflV like protein [Verticillium longisporum]|nr:Cytochrome monooxygenase aflV like protein [Verticillium longisporum]